MSWLDPGLEVVVPLETGRIGLSGLKKLEVRFRNAGEGGIFWSVSMARSDNEGLDFRGVSCGLLASDASSSTISLYVPFCHSEDSSSSFTGGPTAALSSTIPLGFRDIGFVGLRIGAADGSRNCWTER